MGCRRGCPPRGLGGCIRSPARRTKREVLTVALEEYVKELLREQWLQKLGTGFLHMTQEDLERMRADD